MKKWIGLLLFVLTPCLWAQNNGWITNANADREITALFEHAQQVQFTQELTTLFQDQFSSANNKLLNFADTMSAEPPSQFTTISNRPQTAASRPWQMLLVMAADSHKITETLQELRGQVGARTLQQAVLLDITRFEESTSKIKKGKPTSKVKKQSYSNDKMGKKGSSGVRMAGDLYFVFLENGTPKTEQRKIAVNMDSKTLFQTLARNLKKAGTRLYTGMYIHAHSDGSFLDTNNNDMLYLKDLSDVFISQQIKIDFFGLAACHTSSLESVFNLAQGGQIGYFASSSAGEYAPTQFYHFLRHLNQPPRELAASFIHTWQKGITWNTSYNTTNMNVLQLSALKKPLAKYIELYNEVQSYEGEESDAIRQQFRKFFGDFYYNWQSLSTQIVKQRSYISSRLNQDCTATALYNTEKQFLAACDTLLNALKAATLKNWCYSQPHNKIYTGYYPKDSGCLDSVSVTADQYSMLSYFSADK